MVMVKQHNYNIYASNIIKIIIFITLGILLTIYVVKYPQDSLVARLVGYDKIFVLSLQHLYIVGLSSLFAILTAVPLGVFLTRFRFRNLAPRIVGIVNIGQTIPSLAVVALTVGFFGVGATTAIVALWIYSLLPILNNTMIGIIGADPAMIEAAKGMGMKPLRIFIKVELPQALAMIIAGIRTAITINIGSAILAAFVGGGGLGNLIIAGNNISRIQVLVLGASLPVLMALSVDAIFEIIVWKLEV